MEHELEFYQNSATHPEVYTQALEILSRALTFGIEPSLEGVRTLLAELGNPQEQFASIQVAGTNGKSSTVRFLAAILQEHGYATGLYTSPELVEYRERMEIGGQVSSYEQFGHAILAAQRAREDAQRKDPTFEPTEFEILTAAALHLFAQEHVDVAVLEVGLGGRWDATSIVKPELSVVTGVGLDHMKILGDTLEEIAGEKAAIIRPFTPVVLGTKTNITPQVEQVFLQQCEACNVTPVKVREHKNFWITKEPAFMGDTLEISVQGAYANYPHIARVAPHYQAQNMACAILAAEQFMDHALDQAKLQKALMTCVTPGRFDVVQQDPLVLIDACHNPQSVQAFVEALAQVEPDVSSRPALLLAVLADKDVAGIIDALCGEFPHYVVTQTASHRALPAEELATLVAKATGSTPDVYPTVEAALNGNKTNPLICCGSITLAGEVAYHLR